MPKRDPVRVYLEIGSRRTFAGAVDWPGWCRSGRDEEGALDTLLAYAARYAAAIGDGFRFDPPSDVAQLEVVERLKGGSTTDFGAPGEAPAAVEAPLDPAQLHRQVRLLDAAWSTLDRIAHKFADAELRTGPRGGGRTLRKMVDHVTDAERGYLAKLGSRAPADVGELRDAVRTALTARAEDRPVPNPNATRKPWSPRYFVLRATWHVLDHAWEIEDRAE